MPPAARAVVSRVLLALAVLAVSLATASLAAGAVRSIASNHSGVAQSAGIFAHIARVVVLTVGGPVLLQSLGISIAPMACAAPGCGRTIDA